MSILFIVSSKSFLDKPWGSATGNKTTQHKRLLSKEEEKECVAALVISPEARLDVGYILIKMDQSFTNRYPTGPSMPEDGQSEFTSMTCTLNTVKQHHANLPTKAPYKLS